MRTKTDKIKTNILCANYDIIVFTETWLNDSVYDYEFIDHRYSVYRRDRPTDNFKNKTDGGGVLIAVRSDIEANRNVEWECNCELLWVTLAINDNKIQSNSRHKFITLNICVAYNPPPLNLSYTDELCNNLSKTLNYCVHENALNIVIGDFNLSQTMWQQSSDSRSLVPTPSSSQVENSFLDCINYNNLEQCNGVTNSLGRTLDLVLTNSSDTIKVDLCTAPLTTVDKFHPPLEIIVHAMPKKNLQANYSKSFNFYKANYEAINSELSLIDWHDALEIKGATDINKVIDNFYSILHSLFLLHVPIKTRKNANYPTWYSKALIKSLKEKDSYYRQFKKFGNPRDKLTYNLLRNRCAKLTRHCYTQYKNFIENNLHKNPKLFWSFIKNTKQNSHQFPHTMKFGQQAASGGQNICDLFCEYFNSVFKPAASITPPTDEQCIANHTLSTITITSLEIKRALDKLDANKGSGSDSLPPYFLKQCRTTLVKPLLLIFNLTLQLGQYPAQWKLAHVVPIPKSGFSSDIQKYRPISILCAISKLLESIVVRRIYWQVKPFLAYEQHGFLPKKSTLTNLAILSDDIMSTLDRGNEVHAIYTDFSKAFDVVDHNILLNKLAYLGIHGSLLRWIASYLNNRSQLVALCGYKSKQLPISSGIAQGSHLGPLLFAIFINNIPVVITYSKSLLYADDLKVYKEIKRPEDCHQLQTDINSLANWCEANNMTLNTSKCFQINFTRKRHPTEWSYIINGQTLPGVKTARDLGVVVDSTFKFTAHIEHLVSKANKILGFVIRKTKVFRSTACLQLLYNSYVRSVLEYCSPAWNPVYAVHSDRIERVQKRFLYHLSYSQNLCKSLRSYSARLNHFRMESLKTRRVRADLIFVFKLMHGIIDCPELLQRISLNVPKVSARVIRDAPFTLPICRTNVGDHAPINRIMALYNTLKHSIDIYHTTIHLLKIIQLCS